MAAYFGNGYLLNILQRGALPVGESHPRLSQSAVRLEKTLATTDNQLLGVSGNQALEFQSESLDSPVEASTIVKAPKGDRPLSPDVEGSETLTVATRSESREAAELPGTNASQPPAAPDAGDEESNATVRAIPPGSSEPSLPNSLPVTASPAVGGFGHPGPDESSRLGENQPETQSPKRVFELRMPEHFFGQAKGEAFNASQAETAPQRPVVSATVDREAERETAVGHFSESSVPTESHAEGPSQPKTVITSKRPDELSGTPIIQLPQSGSIPDSQKLELTSAVGDVVKEVKRDESPPTRLAPPALEASAPRPRVEQPSKYLQLIQSPVVPTVVAPPARLRINRLDIQVINHVPPPPPLPTHAPDVSQLLEKKYLGRVELLL